MPWISDNKYAMFPPCGRLLTSKNALRFAGYLSPRQANDSAAHVVCSTDCAQIFQYVNICVSICEGDACADESSHNPCKTHSGSKLNNRTLVKLFFVLPNVVGEQKCGRPDVQAVLSGRQLHTNHDLIMYVVGEQSNHRGQWLRETKYHIEAMHRMMVDMDVTGSWDA
jgi:hypothetical protein